jgi:hypothetical protein
MLVFVGVDGYGDVLRAWEYCPDNPTKRVLSFIFRVDL